VPTEHRDPLVIVLDSLYDETFSLEEPTGAQHHWNVTKARKMAEHWCRRQDFVVAGQVSPESLHEGYADLDEAYALSTDLSKPLLFVTLNGEAQLIDGWHRLLKAVITGVPVLPCYVLSEDQADSCLIVKLPPGRGVDWGQHKGVDDDGD
jgi:hypothetical protein